MGLVALAVLLPITDLHSVAALRVLTVGPLLWIALLRAPAYAWRYFASGPLGLFLLFTIASVLCSENRLQTILSLGSWAIEMLAALAAISLGADRAILYLGRFLKALLLGSAVTAVAVPTIGTMNVAGSPWQGLFVHKNALGVLAAFAVVFFAATGKRSTRLWWVAAALVVLLASQSAGGLVAGLAGVFVQALARFVYTRREGSRAWTPSVFYGAILVGCGSVWLISDQVLRLLNRTADLTGRTTVWGVVRDYAASHPTFGTGFGAQIYSGSVLEGAIANARGVALGTTHNGFLSVYLGMGIVGLVLLAAALSRVLMTVERVRRRRGVEQDAVVLALGLFACYLVANVSGDLLLTRGGWFFFTFAVLQLLARSRSPRTRPPVPLAAATRA
jgi:O-antigen ligase